jgi:hypothetical protein
MALTPGSDLGPYETRLPLGGGGIAEDLRLLRQFT